MKQAFYVISDRQADFLGDVPSEFARDTLSVRANLAYELPAEYTGDPAAGPVRYCLMARHAGRVLSRTVPTTGSRRNLSFTHLLLMPQAYPLLDYLLGWDDWFWYEGPDSPEFPELVAQNQMPWRNPDQSRLLSTDWAIWLADPQHEKLQHFTLVAHLCLPPGGRVFIPAKPLDVFRAVYGLARLLPERLVADLTFSTYEHAPAVRSLRVIGTNSIPAGTLEGNDWVFTGQDDLNAATTEAIAYSNRVLAAQLRQPDDLVKFLKIVREFDSIDRLITLVNVILDGPEKVTTDELLRLAEDPLGQSVIVSSLPAVERILTEGDAQRVSRFAATINSNLKGEMRNRLADRVNQAVRIDDIRLVQSLLGTVDCLDPGRSHLNAVGIVEPCRSVEMLRVLSKWAHVDGLKASMFEVSPDLAERFFRSEGNLDNALRAGLVLRHLAAVQPDLLAVFATIGGPAWQLVRDHLLKSDPAQLSSVVTRLLSTSDLSTNHTLTSEILHTVAALDRQIYSDVDICDLVNQMYDAGITTAVDLVRLFSDSRSKPVTWPTRLRGRLALSLLSDGAENALLQLAPREALFALNAGECELGERASRLTAIRQVSDWIGKVSNDKRGEDIPSALRTLVDWRNAIPTAESLRVPFGAEVLRRVFRIRILAPPQWTLADWFIALRPVWQRAAGNFIADWFSAAKTAPASTRVTAYLAAVDVAEQANDTDLRQQVLTEVMVLSFAARDSLVATVSERHWFLREVREPLSWWVRDPIWCTLLLIALGIALGAAAHFLSNFVQ